MIVTIIIAYLFIVMGIGLMSHRMFRRTGEDYFVASRSIGPFVLLMSLFGTNMTAFAILGASGEAFRIGIGVYGLMASSSALIIPAIFFFVGTRLWKLGKRHGYLTQIQFFRDRFESDTLGLVLFIVLVLLLIPYLLIGVMGAGTTLATITSNQIPFWAGSLMVCVVIFVYVTTSGMRGTAWVNTFQTLVFMTLGTVAFFVIINAKGGLANVLAQVGESHPERLIRGESVPPWKLFTYMFIPLSAGMFPHIFTHWLTAKKVENFKVPIMFYPICMIVVWIPSVILGITGLLDFPELQGPAANNVLIKMVELHAPGILGGLLAAGVFAAIMSSLDSQVLTLGNMFTTDVVRHYRFGDEMDDKKQVLTGRLFVVGILGITFLIAQVAPTSIFRLGIWSFTGFASLFPLAVAGVFWKRATKAGAYAAIAVVAAAWLYFFVTSQIMIGPGVMVVGITTMLSVVTLVVVSLMTKPPKDETLAKFFS